MIRILVGDALAQLKTLGDESVHCVVTSPPYWGLRCYGVEGQYGLEATPEEHVARMVEVFREVRRVLRWDGTLWLNYGDSYSGGGGFSPEAPRNLNGSKVFNKRSREYKGRAPAEGLKPKDLIGMPWRVAFALQADGWWLRSDIIWAKPNPMPESVTDRCTKSHEYIFMLAKRATYFYDADAVREEGKDWSHGGPGTGILPTTHYHPDNGGNEGLSALAGRYKSGDQPSTRNLRSVWTIATHPFPEAHFATFPPALVEPCIKAGTSERGCCATCGAPWERVVEIESRPNFQKDGQKHDGTYYRPNIGGVGNDRREKRDHGWRATCAHGGEPVPATVLDPFFGAGTVGLVADRLGRNAIGIELNPKYAAMAEKRIRDDCPMFAQVTK